MSIQDMVRDNILTLNPYSSARSEFSGKAEIFLDANENAYGSVFGSDGLNRYPDPLANQLRDGIAKYKNLRPAQILFGNGSDELVGLILLTFCEPHRDQIVITPPTFDMFEISARAQAVNLVKVHLQPDFSIDLSALIREGKKSKVIFLCSPNNPTGSIIPISQIRKILAETSCLVVVDEAYIDFAEQESVLGLLSEFPKLLVLQTFSKAWGLAGLRLGMLFGSEEAIDFISRVKTPYNINSNTQALGLKALSLKDRMQASVVKIKVERQHLTEELSRLKVVKKIYPSEANFLLVQFDDANFAYDKLLSQGIVVRNRSSVQGCENCMRITVGTPEQNTKLINAIRDLI